MRLDIIKTALLHEEKLLNIALSLYEVSKQIIPRVDLLTEDEIQTEYLDFHDSCYLSGGGGDGKLPF